MRAKWDADADNKLRLLLDTQKQSAQQVARQLGRTVAAIRNRIKKLRNKGSIPDQRAWVPWSAADDAALIAARREGLTATQIALRINRTKQAVYLRVSTLGLAQEPTAAAARPLAGAKKEIPCLCCRAPFTSAGYGNRLCPVCRKLDAGPTPAPTHTYGNTRT